MPSDNPYLALKSLPEIYASIYKEHGEAGLRQGFDIWAKDALKCTPESLEDHAKELELIGLDKVAAIVREYAPKFLPETDLARCPYQNIPPYSLHPKELKAHQADWQRDVRRKRKHGIQWYDRRLPD
jgi:hypothetical protein